MQTVRKPVMESFFVREFPSTLQNVSMAVRQLGKFCKETTGQSEAEEIAVEQVELCVAEALTNIVKHAYKCRNDGIVNVRCALANDQIIVDIEDQGKELPGDLLATEGPREFSADIGELPENGFGWFLIMDQMDDVQYARLSGTNHLKLIKRLF